MPSSSSPSMGKPHAVHKASNREIYAWSAGAATNSVVQSLNANLMPFFNTALGMNAGLIGMATVFPRLLDAFTDPIMGHISDNARTRWGRRRPFIFVGALLSAFFIALLWWAQPGWSQTGLFIWLLAAMALLSLATTIFGVPLEALGYELSDDYNQRTKIQTVKFFFAAVFGLGLPWIYWLTLRPIWGGEIAGFRWIYLFVAVIVVIFGIIPALCCHERFERAANKPKEKIWDGLREAIRNPYFRQIIYIRLANACGFIVFSGMNFYINYYYICQGDKDLETNIGGIGGTVYGALSFGFLFLIPWLGRTIGKRRALLTGLGLQLLGALLNPIIQTPAMPYLQMIGVVLAVPAGLMTNIFVTSFMADVCDLGEVQSGRRMEGTYSAVAGFLTKIEFTILGVLVGVLINLTGMEPGATMQTDVVQQNIRWMAYIPYIFFATLTFWIGLGFKIDAKLMEETRAILDARRTAGGEIV
jgi:GPH family glycoside/pentoside/hexuronide:cation symporter